MEWITIITIITHLKCKQITVEVISDDVRRGWMQMITIIMKASSMIVLVVYMYIWIQCSIHLVQIEIKVIALEFPFNFISFNVSLEQYCTAQIHGKINWNL